MIIYGWGSTNVGSKRALGAICPNCKEPGTLQHNVFSKHTHIFWIPLFPYGKTGISVCRNCGFKIEGKKQMAEDVLREYSELKSDARPAVWQFSGLIIIALLIGGILVAKELDGQDLEAAIASPIAEDVFVYNTEDGNYSLFKVIETSEDSLWVLYNNWVSDQRGSVTELNVDSSFSDIYDQISMEELKEMYKAGKIYSVNHP